MTDEQDWLLRPVVERMCQYESLINGTLDLCDIALMNEALDVRAENEARIQEAVDSMRQRQMAGEQLKQFMMGLGFQLDTAGMAKLEAFVKNTENYAKQSAANVDKLVKTLENYTKGLNRVTSEADKQKQTQDKQNRSYQDFCKQLEECTKGLRLQIEELKKNQEEQDKNTKSTDEGTGSLRRHSEAHRGMREVWKLSKDAVFGFVGALSALAITGEESVRRVSKSFESLFYLSQRSGVAGHSIEALRFQFRSVGLDAELADQAIGSMADHIADMPATLSVISGRIGKTVTNAGEAVTGLAERYAELLRTGQPSEIAAFRDFLRLMGQNENVIAQLGRNIGAANTALELHHKILHDLGFGDGAKVSQLLQERSVAFRKSWVGTQEVLGRVAESFAGALMPGITRFLRAALDGLPDVAGGFEELCKNFDAFIENLIGPKGEKLQQWMKDVGASIKNMGSTENLEKLNSILGSTATVIGAIASSIELIAKYPAIAGALLGLRFGPLGALVGAGVADELTRDENKRAEPAKQYPGILEGGFGAPGAFFNWLFGSGTKEAVPAPATPPVGHQRGGIVGINAHVGEAVLPVSLTNMLLRAANQPQAFGVRGGGLGSLTDILDSLSNDFNQWWSGSASFNPIVQLAQDFYDKLSALLHQLLEDFGFEQKTVEQRAAGGGGGGGGGEGTARPGGRFGGMGPGGGGGGGKAPDIAKGNYRNQAIDYFVSQGWTREQAAGITANLEHESQWNKEAVGDSGKAFGLGQWHPDRQANFKKTFGKDIREATFGEQLAFVNWELNNTEKEAGDRLRKTTSAREAGGVVSQYYERPRDVHGNVAQRGSLAEGIHTGYSPSGTPMPGAGEGMGAGADAGTDARLARVAVGNARPGGLSPVTGMHPEFKARIDRMLQDMPEHLRERFKIYSGYRDAGRQAQVHGSVKHSHHTGTGEAGSGMAADTTTDPQMLSWIAAHPEYGVGYPLAGKIAGEEHHLEPLEGGRRVTNMRAWAEKYNQIRSKAQAIVNTGANVPAANLGTDTMQRNLGAEKPAWRRESPGYGVGADYGGGGDMPKAARADKLEITVTTTGAAHGTGKTSYDMASRESPIKKRNRENSLV